jgi:phosphatidylcholine synthase
MSSAAETLSGPIPRQRLLLACAWGVHLYTALGAAAGLLAIYYAAERNFQLSFTAIGIAIFIDSSDGALARLLDVKHRVPSFDGSLLDNIVDYLTYTVAAVFLMLEAGIIPKSIPGLLLACFIMLASVYGFCQTDAKTDDHYFLGFPNYWNIVAFYLYCLHWPPIVNWLVLGIFGVMVFVPIKYIYPSRTVPLRPVTIAFGIVWAIVTFAMLPMLPAVNPIMLGISLSFIVYYFIASFVLHARSARRRAA